MTRFTSEGIDCVKATPSTPIIGNRANKTLFTSAKVSYGRYIADFLPLTRTSRLNKPDVGRQASEKYPPPEMSPKCPRCVCVARNNSFGERKNSAPLPLLSFSNLLFYALLVLCRR
jgi:hypothetical protein